MAEIGKLQERLVALSEVFAADNTSPYKVLFDEFLLEDEFDSALHAICDYLVFERVAMITLERIGSVQELHSAMHLQDGCVSELEDARSQNLRNLMGGMENLEANGGSEPRK